jgi:hypothetical protein
MSLAPIQASKLKNWWEDNPKTVNHAKHCQPLTMANSLGYYILSPGTFKIIWDGDIQSDCIIEHIDKSHHYEVDVHATFGGFVVQPKFVVMTDEPGDFIYIKNIPNERFPFFTCMEACIEAWWSVANFGLVFMLNRPGEFIVFKGQPIAQMFLYKGYGGAATLVNHDNMPPEYGAWLAKRSRPEYTKDLDYLNGRKYDLSDVPTHIGSWSKADRFKS